MSSSSLEEEVKNAIRNVPDFPIPGIQFKDITTLLLNIEVFNKALDAIAAEFPADSFDLIAGIESRGFIVGTPLATKLNKGFVMIRKPNKLPAEKVGVNYGLEYGKDRVEVHSDSIKPGQRVLIVDDLIATGGSCAAAAELVRLVGGQVIGATFLVELTALNGRKKLEPYTTHVYSVAKFLE